MLAALTWLLIALLAALTWILRLLAGLLSALFDHLVGVPWFELFTETPHLVCGSYSPLGAAVIRSAADGNMRNVGHLMNFGAGY